MYALAGNRAEAAEWLAAAAAACTSVERPVAHVQAQYWLGRTSEDRGDHAAACSAFRDVAKAWGHAAHSVTAEDAKTLAAKLKCPP